MNQMWTDPANDPRIGGDPAGELATLRGYLSNYRLTLELKCGDLSPVQLATRSVPPSAMSLLGLVRHMARVEHFWFQVVLQGKEEDRLYGPDEDGDAGFARVEGTAECVEESFARWRAQVANAEVWLDTQTDETMGEVKVFRESETANVRDILVHMVEEYARHCGHADLLRECLDGRTGE